MKAVYVKEAACIYCHLCEVYCQVAHSQSHDLWKTFKKESPRPVPRSRVEKSGTVSFSVRCQHCADAPCIAACLTGALHRDPLTGAAIVDEERCAGCWTCLLVCPYGAIRQDTAQDRIAKCDLCQGQEQPACVEHCPNEALVYTEVNPNFPAREN